MITGLYVNKISFYKNYFFSRKKKGASDDSTRETCVLSTMRQVTNPTIVLAGTNTPRG